MNTKVILCILKNLLNKNNMHYDIKEDYINQLKILGSSGTDGRDRAKAYERIEEIKEIESWKDFGGI